MMREGAKTSESRASPVVTANVSAEANVSAKTRVSADPSHPLVGRSDVSAETSVTTHERFR
jgi:hypothetical protein